MSVSSIASAAVVAQQAQTQTSIANLLVKKAHEADQELISVIQEAVKSAPPAGTGKAVYITA